MRLSQILAAGLCAAALAFGAARRTQEATSPSAPKVTDSEAVTNPVLGQPEAIAAGEGIYRTRCIICHMQAGGRGPKLFRSKLADEQFLNTVIRGRKGTLMPSFGVMLSIEDVWNVHAFVMSRDRF
jgi:mono/diheme cytochrome c family protein